MAEDIDVDLVAEVIVADILEKIGPLIIQVEVIDFFVFSEQFTIIGWNSERFVSFVDAAKQVKEVAPFRVGDAVEWGDLAPGPGYGVSWQKFTVFAKRYEYYSVYEFLSDANGVIQSVIVRWATEVLYQSEAIIAVILIQFVADFSRTFITHFKKQVRAWSLAYGDWKKAVALKQIVKLEEGIFFAKFLKREKFIDSLGVVSVIEAETDVIADNTPRTFGDGIEIVPALLNRRASGGLITVDIYGWAF
jgi:hypothetical protein